MVAPRQSDTGSLDAFLAELLSEQQKLQTPVTRAATAHALQPSAWRAEKFRELVPLTAPGPGRQYAFEVDLDSCSGCKACVSGCHSLNGLDDEETWRDVGVILAGSDQPPFSQTVTTACHHCADPACLNGCPVLAYEKDPATGIVRHLDDQCIGCSYCVLKCPYDVPKYNQRLGIVRKCDLCHGRLAAGEAPACAQACPTQAIRIVTVSTTAPSPYDAVVSLPQDPAYTRPTTRYVSKKPLPTGLRPADADTPRPQPAHLPLVALLVFSQLALGLMVAETLNPKSQILNITAAALFFAALAASVAHLGQPLRAWRIFLGLRRSWLSREAVLLGAAAPLVALNAALPHLRALPLPAPLTNLIGHWSFGIGPSAVVATALGVFCSAMIYIDTRRHFWRPANTFVRMGGTVIITALAFTSHPLAALALAAKLALENRLLRASRASARLHAGPLRPLTRVRVALGLAALVLFALHQPWFGLLPLILGELVERVLYFRAVDAPKMPGQPAAATP
jgi:Fe-S-cluster-containing dehydrogenase component/DMSO reductase anchor subunit